MRGKEPLFLGGFGGQNPMQVEGRLPVPTYGTSPTWAHATGGDGVCCVRLRDPRRNSPEPGPWLPLLGLINFRVRRLGRAETKNKPVKTYILSIPHLVNESCAVTRETMG